MVKLEEGSTATWEERSLGLIPIASAGLELLKKIDNRYKAIKDKEKRTRANQL